MNQDKRLREIFIDWLCTPRALRRPRTQIELARTLNIHVMTFSVWKQSPEFWTDFVCRLRSRGTHRIPEVTASLVAQANRGDVAADRTFLDNFGPKAWLKVDSHGNEVTPSLDEIFTQSEKDDFPIPTWKEEEEAAQKACSDRQSRQDIPPKLILYPARTVLVLVKLILLLTMSFTLVFRSPAGGNNENYKTNSGKLSRFR